MYVPQTPHLQSKKKNSPCCFTICSGLNTHLLNDTAVAANEELKLRQGPTRHAPPSLAAGVEQVCGHN